MTRIRANCPDCGDVEISPDEMMIEVAHDDDDLVGEGTSYRFECPDCAVTVRKPADERIVQLLISGGVPLEVYDELEAEFPTPGVEHPEAPGDGPALTTDDLLDLHLVLQREDWFDRLAELCS
jgi:predicted RNA-binding Zn-ribbon protein involved in translation (DUF1610 family)